MRPAGMLGAARGVILKILTIRGAEYLERGPRVCSANAAVNTAR